MEFDEKARENLEAVERLRADEDGVKLYLANAVANRAYFAAYHAVAHVAQERGIDFHGRRLLPARPRRSPHAWGRSLENRSASFSK